MSGGVFIFFEIAICFSYNLRFWDQAIIWDICDFHLLIRQNQDVHVNKSVYS